MSYLSPTANTSPSLATMPRSARTLMAIGSAVRIAYGTGALLAPLKMVQARYAPDTHELEDPRLLLRAFGGHQLVTGCLTLAATCSRRHARQAASLSLLIDMLDVGSAALELRTRGHVDQTVLGGIAISGSGILTFAAAYRTLTRA
jgi:hypothetical protein